VTGANDRKYGTDLLDVMSTRVMVGDGAMATRLQAAAVAVTKCVRLQSG
jgi:5-methyltetrahydrofolate--homocysteine methyltransferase